MFYTTETHPFSPFPIFFFQQLFHFLDFHMQWLGFIYAYKLLVILKLKKQSSKVQLLASILITTEQGSGVVFFSICLTYQMVFFQEIMHDPQVAADGFTYEGEALRGWLANGRETSPMTNLRLDHLHLTPNHALRLAIQDWLCKY